MYQKKTKRNFLELKIIIFNNKSVYSHILKERSLVTAETQISGLEEQVEKIFQSPEQIIQRDGNKENMRFGE